MARVRAANGSQTPPRRARVGNFSYRNAWVIDVAGAVAAGLIGYR
jgi:hypothetical protein